MIIKDINVLLINCLSINYSTHDITINNIKEYQGSVWSKNDQISHVWPEFDIGSGFPKKGSVWRSSWGSVSG